MAKDSTTPSSATDFSPEDARQALAPATAPGMSRVRDILLSMSTTPPQVLLLEGGTEADRQSVARWWAALLHCENTASPSSALSPAAGPCLHCPSCLHIGAGLHLDVLAFDGRISNKEDEENPGPVRAFNMENARNLKARIGDNTRSGKRRIVLLSGMDITRDAAANALLKVLEEPSPTTLFVLLTPQREQLLPTLISRSWVLTLPWPDPGHVDPALTPWSEALAGFLTHGRGWWSLTGTKGAVDAPMAGQVVLLCQKALLSTAHSGGDDSLRRHFAGFTMRQRLAASQLLSEAQEALQFNVSPGRVLDWLAVRLFALARITGEV